MSIWQRLIAFLRLDFYSALSSIPLFSSLESNAAGRAERIILTFELDIQKLDCITSRRKIFNWRDEFEVQILNKGKDCFCQFSAHVEKVTDEAGLLRKCFAQPSNEMLKDSFFTLVSAPLAEHARAAENQLNDVIQGFYFTQLPSLSLFIDEIDRPLSILGNLSLRSSNKKEISSKINQLIFGESGIIDCYSQRAQTISQSLLEAMDAKL